MEKKNGGSKRTVMKFEKQTKYVIRKKILSSHDFNECKINTKHLASAANSLESSLRFIMAVSRT